jgi:hypothetical protein
LHTKQANMFHPQRNLDLTRLARWRAWESLRSSNSCADCVDLGDCASYSSDQVQSFIGAYFSSGFFHFSLRSFTISCRASLLPLSAATFWWYVFSSGRVKIDEYV